jgi:hypothetical protein
MAKVWVKRNLIITADGAVRELVSGEPPEEVTSPKRHAPKSGTAIAVLKHLYPPDGRPSRQAVPDSALERDYHDECDRRGIHPSDRVKKASCCVVSAARSSPA